MVESLPREHKTHSTGTTIILFYSYKNNPKPLLFLVITYFYNEKTHIKQKNACYLKN